MINSREHSSWEDSVQSLRLVENNLKIVIDCYYDDPLIGAAERYWRSDEWRSIQELLKGVSGSALDVGAGRGIASYALARDGFSVSALEPDCGDIVGAGAIAKLASEANINIEIVQGFSENLPFADAVFDVVFARAVLHHTRDLIGACREFMRVLKPGGILIAVREHVISCSDDLNGFLEAHPLHRLYGGENAFLLSHYKMALESAGFSSLMVLGPLLSPINFAPYSLLDIQKEVVRRISLYCPIPIVLKCIKRLLAIHAIWFIFVRVAEYFDHRPGRLYSFVGRRPVK